MRNCRNFSIGNLFYVCEKTIYTQIELAPGNYYITIEASWTTLGNLLEIGRIYE
jgi:hypothetical protein